MSTITTIPTIDPADPIDLPAHLRPENEAEAFHPGPDRSILVRGERDAFLRSLQKSPYPAGVTPGNRVTEMQLAAREKYLERQPYLLAAGTSSGKTVAAVAPTFEAGRRAVFVYPYRALLYDQASELLRLAQAFGYNRHSFGYVYGGVNGRELSRQISVDKPFILITPDKLISLFLGDRRGVMAATALLSSSDFFFDEVHSYNTLMRRSLIYFLRSVRMFSERQRMKDRPMFTFASATTPDDLLDELENGLGIDGDRDVIRGPSYTGDAEVSVLVPRSSRTMGQHPIAEDMAARGHTTDSMVIVQNPFDAWMIANSEPMLRSAQLFVGQDKQSERERQQNLSAFMDTPCKFSLVGSSAIQAGVDAAARYLYLQETTGNDTAQGFGRTARAGRSATVVYYGNRLYHLATQGLLKAEYARGEWSQLLRGINPERPPATILSGLAASPYISFWGDDLAAEIVDAEDMQLNRQIRETSRQGHLAFRGLTPYTSYESGERINFRALFRKRLAVERNRVKGAPDAHKYFYAPQRAPVRAHIRGPDDVAYREESTAIRNGRTVILHHLLARVDFGGFGRHWTVLEVGPNEAHGTDFVPDNMHISYMGRPLAGPGLDKGVRFYS